MTPFASSHSRSTLGEARAWARCADVAQVRAALDQQPADEKLRSFVAGKRHATPDWGLGERALYRGQQLVLRRVDEAASDSASLADRFEPGRRAVDSDGRRADDRTARRLEFADAGGVERMDGGDGGAIERGIELAPFARRNDGPGREAHHLKHRADLHRVGRKHLAEQRHGRLFGALSARRLNRALLGFESREIQHRSGQDVLGFGMRRHAESRERRCR